MKRRQLIAILEKSGCILLRHVGRHDIYHNPVNGKSQPIPRHSDVNEILAKKILKDLAKDN